MAKQIAVDKFGSVTQINDSKQAIATAANNARRD
jgi:hypothetical protein